MLPSFLRRRLVATADNPRVPPLLFGVAAHGLIAAVTVDVVDVPTALLPIAAVAAVTLARNLAVLYVWVPFYGCAQIT